jgi:hypothetical protein
MQSVRCTGNPGFALQGEFDVKLHKGDRVLVNVAPFIASPRRHRDAVPCDVLEVDALRVHVATRAPYCRIDLWVEDRWIDDVLRQPELLDTPGGS